MSSNITFGTLFSRLDIPPEVMISLLQKLFSLLIVTEFVLGNVANGFIVLVNCIDLVKRHRISCADGILTALAVSRIGLLWVIIFYWYAILFNPALYSLRVQTIIGITWVISNHFSLWLVTSLSIFYLLKIANFSSLLFLQLKWRAERVVLMVLWGSLFILVCHLTVIIISVKMQMNDYGRNITWKNNLEIMHHLNMTALTLTNIIPFTMSLTAFLLLIFSLWKHLKRMQLSGKGTQDPSTEVHVRAMQTVISFLLLFVIYFLAQIIQIWTFITPKNDSVLMLCEVLRILHPSAHSLILIWGNKTLRQAFLSFLWQLKCWLKKKK
ncbi:taste receptor type 2 member 31-like [Pipistrellus kuhlii]|uniref:taste receptor type 2 member 31-like n=1 Tax=Pipistrellus kuhlii TaxID=59472 RepID=UPI00174F5FC7|nr:taste receptor type 2 member 31-like [Pipistrellus kuhlii]